MSNKIIELKNVNKIYKTKAEEIHILKNINLSFSKGNYDEKEEEYESILGEEIVLVQKAKAIYDWMLLQNILKEDKYLSYSKVKLYNEHKKDLKILKEVLKNLDKKAILQEVFP